jgi:prolyl-tRNA synthetase
LSQEAYFLGSNGQRQLIIMGCYGIGVSRLLPAIVETNNDEKGIIWPNKVSPFDVSLIILDEKLKDQALSFAAVLEGAGFEVLVDDRPQGPGVKFNDAYLIGNPYIVVMGKTFASSQKLDLEIRRSREKYQFSKEELVNFLEKEYAG